jgi:hypothetical protein
MAMNPGKPTIDGVRRYQVWTRLARMVNLGGAVVFAGVAAYIVVLSTEHGWNGFGTFVIVISALVSAVTLTSVFRKYAPGAIGASVDSSGVTFAYSSGRTRRVEWSGKGLPLKIYHTDGTADEISRGRPVQATAGRRWLVDFLSDTEYKALLASARAAGVEVKEGPGPSSFRPDWVSVTLSCEY